VAEFMKKNFVIYSIKSFLKVNKHTTGKITFI